MTVLFAFPDILYLYGCFDYQTVYRGERRRRKKKCNLYYKSFFLLLLLDFRSGIKGFIFIQTGNRRKRMKSRNAHVVAVLVATYVRTFYCHRVDPWMHRLPIQRVSLHSPGYVIVYPDKKESYKGNIFDLTPFSSLLISFYP